MRCFAFLLSLPFAAIAATAAARNAHGLTCFPASYSHLLRQNVASLSAGDCNSLSCGLVFAVLWVCVVPTSTRDEKCRIEECLLCNFARSDVLCPPSTRPPRCAAIRRSSWWKCTSPWCDNILTSLRHSCYLIRYFISHVSLPLPPRRLCFSRRPP